MTWKRNMQRRLGVAADGILGRGSYAALFRHMGATGDRAAELAVGASVHFPRFAIDGTALRLAHFMAQVAHESGGFRWMEEIWGPTAAQRRYEGRADLGNTETGDGYRYRGRGPLQLTGRANYRRYGNLIGIGLEQQPDLVAIPSVGLLVACVYWDQNTINLHADRDDLEAVTRAVNGGLNGLADRRKRLAAMKALAA